MSPEIVGAALGGVGTGLLLLILLGWSNAVRRRQVRAENLMRQYVYRELTEFAKANHLKPPMPPNRVVLEGDW